jgi:hypothetical protein
MGTDYQQNPLRIDDDGTGILWVNANQTFYLNSSAGLMTWALMNNKTEKEIHQIFKKIYPKDFEQVSADFKVFAPQIRDLLDGKAMFAIYVRAESAAPCHFLKSLPHHTGWILH